MGSRSSRASTTPTASWTCSSGKPGRDKHIETYQLFLRNLGALGIPVSCYDFHPANTYTTDIIETPRGYRAPGVQRR